MKIRNLVPILTFYDIHAFRKKGKRNRIFLLNRQIRFGTKQFHFFLFFCEKTTDIN